MIVVDTSVWVDFFRGTHSTQRRVLHRFIEEEEDLALTEIILTEVLQGIPQDREFRRIREYLLEFPVYGARGLQTYLRAADIYRTCRRKGKTIRATVDGVIAAICIEHGLTLFHKDRDFDVIAECTSLQCLKP